MIVLFLQSFQDQIMSQADVIQATGDAIVSFHEIACLTPRYHIFYHHKFVVPISFLAFIAIVHLLYIHTHIHAWCDNYVIRLN